LVSASGCDSIATLILVIASEPNLIINEPNPVCEPQTIDLTNIAIVAGSDPGLNYSYWTDNNATVAIGNPVAVNSSGTYFIKATTGVGCDVIRPVTIIIDKKTNGIRYQDVQVLQNTPISLQARTIGTNDTYLWQPAVGLDAYTIPNPTFRYDKKTEYVINISSGSGCKTVDTVLVIVTNPNPAVYVPRAWSPNNDGHNDYLVPLTVNIAQLNYFRVFNRWGQLLFETNKLNDGWNGLHQGKKQVMDVYYWIIEAVATTGETIRKTGNVVLIR